MALQQLLREAIAARLLRSAHDVSDGGLAVAAAECCLAGGVGAVLVLDDVPCVGGSPGCAAGAGAAETHATAAGPLAERPDLAFFGETPTLVLVSVTAVDAETFEDLCERAGVPCFVLGHVGGGDLAMTLERGGAATLGADAATGGGRDGLRVPVARLEDVYEAALPRAMGD